MEQVPENNQNLYQIPEPPLDNLSVMTTELIENATIASEEELRSKLSSIENLNRINSALISKRAKLTLSAISNAAKYKISDKKVKKDTKEYETLKATADALQKSVDIVRDQIATLRKNIRVINETTSIKRDALKFDIRQQQNLSGGQSEGLRTQMEDLSKIVKFYETFSGISIQHHSSNKYRCRVRKHQKEIIFFIELPNGNNMVKYELHSSTMTLDSLPEELQSNIEFDIKMLPVFLSNVIGSLDVNKQQIVIKWR